MDISRCNEAQKCVIATLPGPLFVAAGAGSGKTFTLKLRTANAFLENESGFKVDSIDQVLAITFTEKAAAELLSRIKDTLFLEGLTDQALEADSAWISTIHGFCSRILRENALEIGLDPEFAMMTEYQAQELKAKARELALRKAQEENPFLRHLSWNWPMVGRGDFESGLIDDADSLIQKACAMPNGLAALAHVDAASSPRSLVEGMQAVTQALASAASAWVNPHKRWELPKMEALARANDGARAWLESGQAQTGISDPAFDAPRLISVLDAFPLLTPSFGKKHEEDADIIDRYKRVYAHTIHEIDAMLGLQAVEGAVQLAQMVDDEFARLKRESGLMDNEDLLQLCLRTLREHPSIAEHYRNHFRLIMVDEFQDTSKVQIEIIRLIAQPQMGNVCVVGDGQQSIYRFRGADVGSFTAYRDELTESFPTMEAKDLQPKLSENFRSHRDILAFVDAVFSQDTSFGADYLQLSPKGAINEIIDPVMDGQPRITLDIEHYAVGDGGIRASQALRDSARRIAEHFASLKQAYADAKVQERQTFALLLGKTKNAQVYIDALRDAGLESMMTSGSILMHTDEAKLVMALMRYAVNPQDEQPLLECLTSSLFAISDDALLALAYDRRGEKWCHRNLSWGFQHLDELMDSELPEADIRALSLAKQVLDRFAQRARRGRLTLALRQAFVESGYLDRARARGVNGLASVGNLSKITAMLQDVEREASGIALRAAAFEAKMANAKEAPGLLSVTESDFVQIMTVHGSKGLEFDHVALAEIKNGADKAPDFMVENEGDATFALSKKGLGIDEQTRAVAAEMLDEAGVAALHDVRTPGELRCILERVSKEEARNEARRLFYVGCTRAVKSLYVSCVLSRGPRSQKKEPYENAGILREVYEAFEWDLDAEYYVDETRYDYGGTHPLRMVFEHLTEEREVRLAQEHAEMSDDTREKPAEDGGEAAPFKVPVRSIPGMPRQIPFQAERSNVRSYSSLVHQGPLSLQEAVIDEGEAGDARLLLRETGEDATALGTAFHRLAQLAIIQRNANGVPCLKAPLEGYVQAQVRKLDVTQLQEARLNTALEAWFASPQAEELCSYDALDAEVPFMVQLSGPEDESLYLEGEIDALATKGNAAFLVDYKTGGSKRESAEQIRAKHELQAQCYAYALLRSGYCTVKATFVRVEQLEDGMPQTVTYQFASSDIPVLERQILSHWPNA